MRLFSFDRGDPFILEWPTPEPGFEWPRILSPRMQLFVGG